MEFGQKNYGGQATQSAGNAPSTVFGGASAGGLDMGGDSSKVKMGILGGIVAIFGIGAAVALSGGDDKVAAQQQAQADQQQMMTPTETAAGPGAEMAADPSADSNAAAMATATAADPMATASASAPAAIPAPATEQMAATANAPAPEPAAAAAATESKVAMNPEPATKAPTVDPAVSANLAAAESDSSAETASATPPASDQAVASTQSERVASEKPKAAPTNKPLPQAADALDAWWQKSEANTSGFGVQFVGQAADQPSLVIRLSQLADPNVAAQHIKLKAADGTEVATNWQKGANDYVLVNPNLAPGRYTVSIDPGLTSTTGSTLGTPLNGPIYIQ